MSAVLDTVLEKPIEEIAEAEEQEDGIRPYRFTVRQLFAAVEADIFEHPERLELIDGEILEKVTAQKRPHYSSVRAATKVLERAFGPEYEVRPQGRFEFSEYDYVEPDVMVVPGTYLNYVDKDPEPVEVLLILEVSDTTIRTDRGKKLAKYARIGIREYWIINLNTLRVEVYREPAEMPNSKFGYGYQVSTQRAYGESVSTLALPDTVILVADLMPGRQDEPANPAN
jgi:Uma2 family endonuclease